MVATASAIDHATTILTVPAVFTVRLMSDQRQASVIAFDIVSQWFRLDDKEFEHVTYKVTKTVKNRVDTMFETTIRLDMNQGGPLHRSRFHVEHMPVASGGVYFLEVYDGSSQEQIAHVPFIIEVAYFGIDASHEEGMQVARVPVETLMAKERRDPPVIKGDFSVGLVGVDEVEGNAGDPSGDGSGDGPAGDHDGDGGSKA